MQFFRHFFIAFAITACSVFAGSTSLKPEAVPVPKSQEEWESQKKLLKENGYLWIKDFFSDEQVLLIQNWAEEINRSAQRLLHISQSSGFDLQFFAKNLSSSLIVVPEANNPNLVCRAEDLSSCFPSLFYFITGTATEYIGQLLGEPYVLYKDKINFKWPGGGAFLPHQDYPAYELLGAKQHITAMISIDPATLENGCLYVAQDWKKAFQGDEKVQQEALEKGQVVLPYTIGGSQHGAITAECCEKMTWVPLETSPKDLVIFDSFIPHYSKPNRSQNSRRAMFFTHNRLAEGDFRKAYYYAKRQDPDNPIFHIGTPTKARNK